MPSVVISPFNVVNFPEGGGHCWVYLQYAQGLRELGCDVYWLENFRSTGNAKSDEVILATFFERMERFGLGGRIILYISGGPIGAGKAPRQYLGRSPADHRRRADERNEAPAP